MNRWLCQLCVFAALLAGAARCRPSSPARDDAEDAPPPPPPGTSLVEPGRGEPKTADLTGQYANELTLYLGDRRDDGTVAGAQSFVATLDEPGTLVLFGSKRAAAVCDQVLGEERVVVRELNDDGVTTQLRALAPNVPLRYLEKKRLVIEVFATAQAACAAQSPISIKLALRFFPIEDVPTRILTGGEDPDGDDGGGDEDPRPPVPPLPPSEPCPPVDVPGGLLVYGTNSAADGCQETFRWSLASVVKASRAEDCRAPALAIEGTGTDGRLLKIAAKHADYETNLAWLLAPDPDTAKRLAAALKAGNFPAVAVDGDACLAQTPPAGTPRLAALALPDSLTLFRGDAREACSADAVAAVPLREDGQSLAVTYAYADAAHFSYRLEWKHQASQDVTRTLKDKTKAQVALYNRRTRSYVTAWHDVAVDQVTKGDWTLSDPAALRRVLPYQRDLELVFHVTPAGAACGVYLSYALGSTFLDSNRGDAFRDLTQPGRSRFLVRESDLPAR